MRILGELPHRIYKITVFKHDAKTLLKVEDGFLEQTYKFRDIPELGTLSQIAAQLDEPFWAACAEIFIQMRQQQNRILHKALDLERLDMPNIL